MKRRTFCASAISALTAAALPLPRARATTGGGEIPAMGASGRQLVLQPAEIDELRAALRGELLVPGQEGYDAARRVWNGAFDRKPALIVRCAGAADVVQAVNFASSQALLTAVRGGGHSLSGQSVCDGGLMIDLAPMKSIRIDPAGKTARLEPGVLLGQFDREAQAFGLATTAGTVSHTGAAGLTLGGGFGRIGRKFGLTCDNLISADVVTAAGRLVRASASDNPELLWGLRGGGGNFGVVTSFEYRLHALDPTVRGGPLVFPFDGARTLLRSFADFISGASDDLCADVLIVPTPDGQRVVALDVCHIGPAAAAERDLAQLRKLGKPLQDGLRPNRYVEIQRAGDDNYAAGRCYYIKSGFVHGITPAVIDTVVGYLESAPQLGVIDFPHMGGAIGRVAPGATAFWHREARHSLMIAGIWTDPAAAERTMQWVRGGWKVFEPLTDGFYVNEVTYEEADLRRVRGNYGGNYARLAALKRQYDPSNLFRLNANIKPTS